MLERLSGRTGALGEHRVVMPPSVQSMLCCDMTRPFLELVTDFKYL